MHKKRESKSNTPVRDGCPYCGKKWDKHLGVQGTCLGLQIAMKALQKVVSKPMPKGALAQARAMYYFLLTQGF